MNLLDTQFHTKNHKYIIYEYSVKSIDIFEFVLYNVNVNNDRR